MALTDFNHAKASFRTHSAAKRFSLTTLLSVWRSRRALAQLDANALADIGVSAKSAHKEAAKPIWDVPANWRA
ncbi:MAG: DUF1127 domain-containing protein [Tateyamaria sp.]|jgi:uncharacterized protein YjiS (DUF1127 family)|uniref:DUF1127 domain-containing protein n=1 Tax=unclassified Tateyamaria TaxID=2645127 RepID=UPI000D54CBAD|nr:DUF1127 domain-containing protein [Tateyamaria sp. Alg231-49]